MGCCGRFRVYHVRFLITLNAFTIPLSYGRREDQAMSAYSENKPPPEQWGYYYKQCSGEQGKAMKQYGNLTYSRSVWRQVRHIKCPQWVCIGIRKSKLQMVQMNFLSIFLRSSSVILVPGMIRKMYDVSTTKQK